MERRVGECALLKAALIAGLGAPAVPSRTHYFLVDLAGTGVEAGHLLARLRPCGIFLRDFAGFSEILPQRYVRITTQSEPDNVRIAAAVNARPGSSNRG